MTVDGEHGACPQWGTEVTAPAGYSISSDTRQRFRAGGRVTYVTLSSDAAAAAALAPSSGSVMSLDSAGVLLYQRLSYIALNLKYH